MKTAILTALAGALVAATATVTPALAMYFVKINSTIVESTQQKAQAKTNMPGAIEIELENIMLHNVSNIRYSASVIVFPESGVGLIKNVAPAEGTAGAFDSYWKTRNTKEDSLGMLVIHSIGDQGFECHQNGMWGDLMLLDCKSIRKSIMVCTAEEELESSNSCYYGYKETQM